MEGAREDSAVRLRRRLLASIASAALACCVASACSGNVATVYGAYGESGGGGPVVLCASAPDPNFPFCGPTCPDGPPGTETNVTCGQCSNRACASELSCAQTDCGAFYTCACECTLYDYMCQNACPLTSACQACIASLRACSDRATSTVCSSQCPGG